MPNMSHPVRVTGLSIAVMLAASGARADQDFYAGESLTIVAGFHPAAKSTAKCACSRATSPNTLFAQPSHCRQEHARRGWNRPR